MVSLRGCPWEELVRSARCPCRRLRCLSPWPRSKSTIPTSTLTSSTSTGTRLREGRPEALGKAAPAGPFGGGRLEQAPLPGLVRRPRGVSAAGGGGERGPGLPGARGAPSPRGGAAPCRAVPLRGGFLRSCPPFHQLGGRVGDGDAALGWPFPDDRSVSRQRKPQAAGAEGSSGG